MNRRHVYDDGGGDTGATFGLETRGSAVTLRYDSRGTTAGTRAYRAGLMAILGRLQAAGFTLSDLVVDSAKVQGLPRADRRLRMPGYGLPLKLDGVDLGKLRAAMHTAAARVGRPPGAKGGGNGTKKLRIYLKPDGATPPVSSTEDYLAGLPRKAAAA